MMKSNIRSFAATIGVYPVVLGAAMVLTGLAAEYEWPQALRYLIALLPVVPVVLAVLVLARALGELDELQRRIQLEALAFSLAGVVLVTVTVGMLAMAGLETPNWAWVALLAAMLWGTGQFLAGRKYQ